MIERFFSRGIKKLGTEITPVYTAPIDINNAFVTGFFVSNVTDRNTTMEVLLYQKKIDEYVSLTSAETPLPAGSTAAVAALGQRIQLTPGDGLYIKMGHEESADVMISVSEIMYSREEREMMKQQAEENKEDNQAEKE